MDENLRDHGTVAENSFLFLQNHVQKVSCEVLGRELFAQLCNAHVCTQQDVPGCKCAK